MTPHFLNLKNHQNYIIKHHRREYLSTNNLKYKALTIGGKLSNRVERLKTRRFDQHLVGPR